MLGKSHDDNDRICSIIIHYLKNPQFNSILPPQIFYFSQGADLRRLLGQYRAQRKQAEPQRSVP